MYFFLVHNTESGGKDEQRGSDTPIMEICFHIYYQGMFVLKKVYEPWE